MSCAATCWMLSCPPVIINEATLFLISTRFFNVIWFCTQFNRSAILKYKEDALKKADSTVVDNYHIVIVPADTSESTRYIEEYTKKPENFKDDSCKKYCSNGDYLVVSFKKEE